MISSTLRAVPLLLLFLPRASGSAPQEEMRNTAHVRVHPELDLLLKRAPALVAEGRYAQALAIYEEAVEKGPDTVIPVDRARGRGVREYVLGEIGKWPAEGRAAYRRSIDPRAGQLFESAQRNRDAEALERLVEQYPYSSFTGDALSLAANLRQDSGDGAGAAAALERLLALEGQVPQPALLARLGMAWSRAGEKARVEELAVRAEREHRGAAVRVAGRDVDLAGHLRELARGARPRVSAPPLTIPAWEMLGGAPSGWRVAEPGVEPARPVWSVQIQRPRFDQQEEAGARFGAGLSYTPAFRPIFPAVSDGVLFVHNGNTVHALNFYASAPDPLWQFRVPPPGDPMFDDRVIHAVTAHEGRVYATLVTAMGGSEDQLGYVRVKFPFPRRALFALDASSGRLLWQFGGRLEGKDLPEVATFSAPPAPEGDRLYVGAVEQRHPTDPFKHHVLCLDAATGRTIWSTFVASGGTEINLFGNSTRESLGTPVCVTADSVVYGTNHGVIAAMEKRTGRLRWTYRYRQLPVNPTRNVYVSKNPLGWVNTPPVAALGIVVVTPTDSPAFYGLELATGERLWEGFRFPQVRSIYGLRGSTLVVGGEVIEFYDLLSGRLLARTPERVAGTGRGVVAADGVIVPGYDKVRRVAFDGSWDETQAWEWPAEGEGGNLLVVDGAVVRSTLDTVSVYFNRRDQEQAVRAALELDPNDLSLKYRGALRLLQAGKSAEAMKLLEAVVERAPASPRPEDERLLRSARRRLHALAMEAGRAALQARDFERAAKSFETAANAAPDASARIDAAFQGGRIFVERREWARAVDAFQKLLVSDGAFEEARAQIDVVLRAAGRDPYQNHEEEARRRLEQARREGSFEALAGVFRTHPNSLAAEEGLFDAAAVPARLGRADEEVAALRTYLREYPGSSRSPEAHARLVRALERRGHFPSAAGILRRMQRAFPDAEVTEGESRVRVRDFVERRLRAPDYARPPGAAGVALAPPLKKAFEYMDKESRDGVPLVPGGLPPASAAGLVFMNFDGEVKAVDVRRGVEAWKQRVARSVRLAVFHEESIVLAGESAVIRVAAATGKVEWSHSPGRTMRGFTAAGGILCYHTAGARGDSAFAVEALDLGRGTPAWSQGFDGMAASDLHAAGDTVMFLTVAPNKIQAFELETGRKLTDALYPPGPPGRVIHFSEDLVVIHGERRYLDGYAMPAGALLWRSPVGVQAVRAMEATPAGLAILGAAVGMRGDESPYLAVVELGGGKILRLRNLPAGEDPRFMKADSERAYLVARGAGRAVTVRALRLADLSDAWTASPGEPDATLAPRPLILARDHLVLGFFDSDAGGKFCYGGIVLDKGGRAVQNIRSGFVFEQPPNYAVTPEGVVFSVDNRIEGWR